jgi:hypothetical protein
LELCTCHGFGSKPRWNQQGNWRRDIREPARVLTAVLDFIKSNKPSYPQFEAWVKKNGTQVDKGSIDKLNAAIRGYNHDDGTRKSVLGANGLPDDAQAPKDAVNLNNLDDWKEFHDAVLK